MNEHVFFPFVILLDEQKLFFVYIHNFCRYSAVFCILVLKIDHKWCVNFIHTKGSLGNFQFWRKIKIKILGQQGVGDG